MWKTTFREIRHSFGRYMAILAIISLGVGFFAGLKITRPAMVSAADGYWREKQLFDHRLISTLGFEQEDVEAFAGQEDVRAAEGAVSADILYTDESGNEQVMKAHSLPSQINRLELKEGRLPEKGDECAMDARLYSSGQLGGKISISPSNEKEDAELFAYREYTVVGLVDSSYYANFERGNTSLGSGKISGFMYIPLEGFDCDYYTEVFIKFDQDYPIYSQDYEEYMEGKQDEWDTLCAQRVEGRYESIKEEAEEKLADAERELEEQSKKAEDELADAKKELTDAEKELEEGREEIEKAEDELARREKELSESEDGLSRQEELLDAQEQELLGQAAAMQMAAGSGGDLGAAAQAQLAAAQAQIAAGREQITAGREEIAAGKSQLKEAQQEIEEKKEELTDAEEEIAQGWQEYDDAEQEFEEKIADAREEISDARKELEDLEEPDHYVLGRESNVGYACFENDSGIIEGIANVVPLFFFLVAALVCMTTMNRMVEEQRTQIGVLKALGYGEGVIMSKYLFYSGSAAILGCVGGFLGGTYLFPQVIWTAYGIMYDLCPMAYIFDAGLAFISAVVALLCSMGATWFTCKSELLEVAANLMRPKSPKAGKRVLLERFPFIWGRLKFLHKVSIRNILRFKRRFFMMLVGISGCTALLVTGFGIRDSISDVGRQQFEDIQVFDMSVTFKDAQDGDGPEDFAQAAGEVAQTYAWFSEQSVDLEFGRHIKSVSLVVPKEDPTEDFLRFQTLSGEEIPFPAKGNAILSHKLCENYGISVGDVITLRDEDMHEMELTVSGIFKNFVYNYVYISGDTYRTFVGEDAPFKTAYVNLREGQNAHQASAAFMKLSDVASVTVNADTEERFASMMASLDYVVLLIILCAAFLAFIVLYNLTNINITERVREIATLKVLGFFRNETASYVFRENLILTAIGTGAGLVLGHFLHSFVMSQINIDMIAFDVHIKPASCFYSILLTILFTCVVDLFMSVKLESINMAESLKSVD